MASDTPATSTSYHKPKPSVRKSKLETTKARSEDELVKFFLHGSYDIQRGPMHDSEISEMNNKIMCMDDENKMNSNLNTEDQKIKARCMFEETYLFNISVKQPDTKELSKQINVRIEKAPSDTKITNDEDINEISSIFDEEEKDEVDSVIFNGISSSTPDIVLTKLTLADMINQTLTTIPTSSTESSNQVNENRSWYIDQQNDMHTSKKSEHVSPSKSTEQLNKTPPPDIFPSIVQSPTFTRNMSEDEKLFEYLDYLETKDETNKPIKSSNISITVIETTLLLLFDFL